MARGQSTYLRWEKIGRSRKYLDYGLLAMYESAALIFRGTDSLSLNAFTNTLSWSTLTIFSPISGNKITVPSGSLSVPDGHLVFIRDIEHPIQTETKSLSSGSPTAKTTRQPTNLFLGGRIGTSFYFFPDGSGTSPVPLVLTEDVSLPIRNWLDAGFPPAALQTVTDGNGKVEVRAFSGVSVQAVLIPWEIPSDLKVSSGIRFKTIGFTLYAAGTPAGLSFKMSGYMIGDGDALNGTPGTEEEAVAVITGYAANTRFESAWSAAIPLTGLAGGKTAMLRFERDVGDPDDTETNAAGVSNVIFRYEREY